MQPEVMNIKCSDIIEATVEAFPNKQVKWNFVVTHIQKQLILIMKTVTNFQNTKTNNNQKILKKKEIVEINE